LIANTHGAHASGENLTIDLISIPQQVCWCLVPSAGFRELAGEPLGMMRLFSVGSISTFLSRSTRS